MSRLRLAAEAVLSTPPCHVCNGQDRFRPKCADSNTEIRCGCVYADACKELRAALDAPRVGVTVATVKTTLLRPVAWKRIEAIDTGIEGDTADWEPAKEAFADEAARTIVQTHVAEAFCDAEATEAVRDLLGVLDDYMGELERRDEGFSSNGALRSSIAAARLHFPKERT